MGRSKTDGKLIDALAIRDTTAHNSDPVNDIGVLGSGLCAAENGLNQDVSVQYQGSFDQTTWHNIGSASTVIAKSGSVLGVAADTFSDPWPYFRAVATCSVAPASGSLTIWYSWVEDR